MHNKNKLFYSEKDLANSSQQLQLNKSQLWEEIRDTPAENIHGGKWPDPEWLRDWLPWPF